MARAAIGLTIPTRGDHPDLLAGIIAASGLPAERIVIVATRVGTPDFDGATMLHDYGPTNIHRWWNKGIDHLERAGCARVAVLNDDVSIATDFLSTLAAAMDDTGATLTHPGFGAMTGWAWMLNLAHGVRPDESFMWWWGDNDLWMRAAAVGGIVACPTAAITHHTPNKATAESPVLQELIERDRITWAARVAGH